MTVFHDLEDGGDKALPPSLKNHSIFGENVMILYLSIRCYCLLGDYRTYDKIWPRGESLTLLNLPQTHLCAVVLVHAFVPDPPTHVNNLELVPQILAEQFDFGVSICHPHIPLPLCVYTLDKTSLNSC